MSVAPSRDGARTPRSTTKPRGTRPGALSDSQVSARRDELRRRRHNCALEHASTVAEFRCGRLYGWRMDATVTLPDGRTVSVWEGGSPDGVPVVFHHGTPAGRLQAALGAEAALREDVRLVSFDRPGY